MRGEEITSKGGEVEVSLPQLGWGFPAFGWDFTSPVTSAGFGAHGSPIP